ncbi:MAG TPA: accessory Sec system translocase SecA2 [bacterium]|nr:accessory Sec system translocase SecA2 [bacterium]
MPSLRTRFERWLSRARGVPVTYDLKPYERRLAKINAREAELQTQSDEQLRALAMSLRQRAREGVTLDRLTDEGFALVREAARRVLTMRPYDVQMIAGLALHDGRVIEMETGEGKTLAAVAPAWLNALTGEGVHVLTFNDYLARRDAQWMGPVYEFLGLRVGHVQEGMDLRERQAAYRADVTYGTAKEIGFDYLRDQLAASVDELRQRSYHFAIVDEADSLLIDEARIPLVLAGSTAERPPEPARLAATVAELRPTIDYETDEHERNVFLTDIGLERLEQRLGVASLHDEAHRDLLTTINLALHARVLLHRDIDYIVRDERVELVDEFTGRVADNRRWPDGLQAALEAKENVGSQEDGRILGSIALQYFMRLYPKLAGMTGTAVPAAEELAQFYELGVVVVPPNKPCVRRDEGDLVFSTQAAKEKALVEAIRRIHAAGQPVLVGTRTVGESERLAEALQRAGIACQVLNAKNDELEAQIIAQAGHAGAVTISTNMAGRGTDIRLGADDFERRRVAQLGGLFVIGTNRHESRRIDDQLRGRCGRQGDPGASQFFVSLEDELIVKYGLRELLPKTEGESAIDDPRAMREIARAQRIIEGENLSIRKTLAKYTAIVEEQRRMLRDKRDAVLHDEFDSVTAEHEPEFYMKLVERVGERGVRLAERTVTLYHLDRAWSDHLATVADIREGIHLYSIGQTNIYGVPKDPLNEYQIRIDEAFGAMVRKLEEDIVQTMRTVTITPEGLDARREKLTGPSSTWTYLVNDMPYGYGFERFFKGMKQRILSSPLFR